MQKKARMRKKNIERRNRKHNKKVSKKSKHISYYIKYSLNKTIKIEIIFLDFKKSVDKEQTSKIII